jgi:hypothetical protein
MGAGDSDLNTARTHYVAAVRRNSGSVSGDWQERIAREPGVMVLGRTGTRMQFEAEAETARRLIAELGSAIAIEEAADRSPRM